MREFKFRVWDGKMNDWETVKKLVILGHIFNDKRYKVMQFTGMKDDAGHEIYEGDILLVRDMPSSPNEKEYRSEVKYRNGCFVLSDSHREDLPILYLNERYINGYKPLNVKVIGNVLEMPDWNF